VEVLCLEMEKLCRPSNSICDILEIVMTSLKPSAHQDEMSGGDDDDCDGDDYDGEDCGDEYYVSEEDEVPPPLTSQ